MTNADLHKYEVELLMLQAKALRRDLNTARAERDALHVANFTLRKKIADMQSVIDKANGTVTDLFPLKAQRVSFSPSGQ